MNPNTLNDYNEWLRHSPDVILEAVKRAGGWARVFSGPLPKWAHRVRNYFNKEPMVLIRYDEYTARNFVGQVTETIKTWKSKTAKVKGIMGLSGDVYRDETNTTWFQMDAASTIYHWGGDVSWEFAEGVRQYFRGQMVTPVFKLIAFDGSGGSKETILRNMPIPGMQIIGNQMRRANLCDGNVPEYVANLTVTDPKYQGSYNYAETTDVGPSSHTDYDVTTHKKWAKLYLNPPNRFSKLSERRFPMNDEQGKPLASQE